VLPVVIVAALGVGGFAYWESTRTPKPASTPKPPPSASTAASSSAPAAVSAVEPPPAMPPGPRWSVLVADAQVKLARGEIDEAQKRVKEAFDSTGAGPARALSEHLAVAAANKGPCKLLGIGRLRPPALVTGVAGRPVLMRTSAAVLALYTDDHETQMHDHAYAVSLDPMMRGLHAPIDVTPEAEHVARIEAQVLGERVAVAFVDTRGQAPGLFARWLDAKGTIAGPAMMLGTPRSGTPALAADGKSVWAAWDEKVDNDRMEMFLGRIPATGEPTPAIRIVDLRKGALRPKLAPPDIAVSAGALEIVFRVDRDAERSVQHLHAPIEGDALPSGLPADPKAKDDRSIGTSKTLSSKPDKGDTPSVACGKDGCFVVWHLEKPGSGGGAFAAFIEAKSGQLLWRKKFASSGGRPTVAFGENGARVAWYEGGKVRTASIDKDGIGAPSTLARVAGDQPSPSIVAGANPGEWTIGWLDFEAGRLEPYALRAMCR
jgi:serine/threonine-protein kinase